MPLPKPRTGESQDDFMGRCMGDSNVQQDFPKQPQRVAVCMSQWRRAHGGDKPDKADEGAADAAAE